MQALLITFFEYHWEANERYIHQLPQIDVFPERVISLMSHILNAHLIWLNRILPEGPAYEVWEEHHPAVMADLNKQAHQRTLTILATADLSEVISYQNSKGQSFTNSIQDILLHIVNHGTYHRGQLALLFRESEIAPPGTDYIFYRREG